MSQIKKSKEEIQRLHEQYLNDRIIPHYWINYHHLKLQNGKYNRIYRAYSYNRSY